MDNMTNAMIHCVTIDAYQNEPSSWDTPWTPSIESTSY